MLEEHLVRRDHAPAHGRLPVGAVGSEVDLGRDHVDDAVDDVVLRGDVVVERHRLDAELLRDLPHAHGLDPALVGELHRGAQDAISAERCALGHEVLDRLTPYV